MTESAKKRVPPRGERIARRILIAAIVLLIVVFAGSFIKVPYAVEKPGPVTDTLGELSGGEELITVDGHQSYPTKGDLYFTTVRVLGGPGRHINVWEWVFGHLDPNSRVVPEEAIFGGRTQEEVKEVNAALMQGSQKTAIAVGMRSTGLEVPQEVMVARIKEGSPAEGKLELEDRVTSVDGERTSTVGAVVEAISDRQPGDEVRVGYQRDGEKGRVTITTTDLGGGRAGIGVGIEPRYDYPFKVSIDAGDVGGPSAGTMFALAVRDTLTPGPMTGGESIAGTGTISDEGEVGPIGGIAQKMVGAQEGGAEWFLAPEANCDQVVGNVPDGLKVVPVGTFEDATEAVDAIADGKAEDLAGCE